MCPICIATAAIVAGSVTSTGGLAAMAAKKFCVKSAAQQLSTPAKEDRHEQHHD
jgi:hypothetical protein